LSLALYMDVHIPHAITHGMRRKGIDVLTAQDDGADELEDEALLNRASSLNRVLFTFDRDFLRDTSLLQQADKEFAGVITIRSKRVSLQRCLGDLQLVCEVFEPEELANRVFYLPL